MNIFEKLFAQTEIPKLYPVHFTLPRGTIKRAEIEALLFGEFAEKRLDCQIRPGMSVAIAVGSREITNLAEIVKTVVEFVKRSGGIPFIFPAMGSHGGAAAEGQLKVLSGYGVTEAAMGCPIRSSMETVQISTTAGGLPVHIDKYADEADGIIVIGRI